MHFKNDFSLHKGNDKEQIFLSFFCLLEETLTKDHNEVL